MSFRTCAKAPFPGGGQTRTSGLGAAFATDPEGAARYLFAASSNGLEDADPSSPVSVVPLEDCRIFMRELAGNPELAQLWASELTNAQSRAVSPERLGPAMVEADPAAALAFGQQLSGDDRRKFFDSAFASWAKWSC